jgi:hypothetical protein
MKPEISREIKQQNVFLKRKHFYRMNLKRIYDYWNTEEENHLEMYAMKGKKNI